MKKTEYLKKQTDELALKIRELIIEFKNENGECDIQINVDQRYSTCNKLRLPVSLDVDVFITI